MKPVSLNESESALLQRIAAQVAQPSAKIPNHIDAVVADSDLEVVEPPVVEKTWDFEGFGPKARILTSFGYVPMEALRRRDPIKTFDGRFLEVELVDEIRLDRRYLIDHPEAQPIRLPKNSVGGAGPNTDLYVSGAQKLRSTDRTNESVIAEDMIGRAGIMRKSHGYFTYYRFHCGEPCTVQIDGLWCEISGPAAKAN